MKEPSFAEQVKEELARKNFTSAGKASKMERNRARLRDLFLREGSMSDPAKANHLEFVCEDEKEAARVRTLLDGFGIHAGVVRRNGRHVVYVKDGEDIVSLLGEMGAHVSLMEMENRRIYKDMRNAVNRRVNCDAANIAKAVRASAGQIEAIRFLQTHGGWGRLDASLKEAANCRLRHPDATLQELASQMDPPLTKSGMNHRLKKIQERAAELRELP